MDCLFYAGDYVMLLTHTVAALHGSKCYICLRWEPRFRVVTEFAQVNTTNKCQGQTSEPVLFQYARLWKPELINTFHDR